MRKAGILLVLVLSFGLSACAQEKAVLIDDFEGAITGGPQGSVDFGAGNGSSVEVTADTGIKYSGSQSLKVTYDAVSGGYMWIARGFGLDAQNASWLVKPQDIDWKSLIAFRFYMYGSKSGAAIAFDIKDNGNEMWRFMVNDDFQGWKEIVCPFAQFLARSDWQPDNADGNGVLDFPVKSFQFEPRPVAKGVLYFDRMEVTK